MPPLQNMACVICMENFPTNQLGIKCPNDHFICNNDLKSYVAENVFPQLYKLRDNRCAILCPIGGCNSAFNSLILFSKLPGREKSRYVSIIDDLLGNDANLKMLKSTLIDLMTLKCPTCKTPVDPLPEACSAVMCLNCGNHYCNYCFQGFSSGITEKNRSAAHEHAAVHNDSEKPESRDAFLSADVVAIGQRQYRKKQLEKCISIAMCSTEYGINGRHDVSLALIQCSLEFEDMGLDLLDLWNAAASHCQVKDLKVAINMKKNKEMPVAATVTEVDDATVICDGDKGDPSSTYDADKDFVDGGDAIEANHERVLRRRRNGTSMDDVIASTDALTGNLESPTPNPAAIRLSANKHGGLQLANAIIASNSHAIMQIIHSFQDDLDVNYVDTRHGHPVASLAILASQPWAAKLLIKRGANPLKQNSGGRSVLYIATEAGLLDVVQCIIEANPSINLNEPTTSEIQKYHPIHVAARYNHGHLINALVGYGADLDPEEKEHGYTPLMLALVLTHEWAAAELIKAGSQVRYLASNGRTPMFVAAEKGLSSMIGLMMLHGEIDVNEPVVRPSGLRLLHVAAFHKRPHVVAQLIEAGANVNQLDDEGGYTPLAMSIIGNNPAAAIEIIAAGADINYPSRSGRKPLYVAVEKGLTDVVRALLGHGSVDVNEPVTSESSAARPLHVAVLHGQSHLIPILIGLGADVNIADEDRLCTPLLMAIILQDVWSVRLLLKANADATRLSREGRSAMYIAAEKGNSTIIKLLVNFCAADINKPTTTEPHQGNALHIAVMFDNSFTVMDLLQMGANINLPDSLGRRPLDLAKETESEGALEVLNRHFLSLHADGSLAIPNTANAIDDPFHVQHFPAADIANMPHHPVRRRNQQRNNRERQTQITRNAPQVGQQPPANANVNGIPQMRLGGGGGGIPVGNNRANQVRLQRPNPNVPVATAVQAPQYVVGQRRRDPPILQIPQDALPGGTGAGVISPLLQQQYHAEPLHVNIRGNRYLNAIRMPANEVTSTTSGNSNRRLPAGNDNRNSMNDDEEADD